MPTGLPPAGTRWGRPLVACGGLCVLAALVVTRAVSDPSPWLHLRVGRFLLDGGRFGLPDPLGSNASRPWIPTQWLPSLLAAALDALAGTPSIAWLRVVAVIALFLVLLVELRHRAAPGPAVVGAALMTAGVLPMMTERPQTGAMVLLALMVHGWSRSVADRPRWWLVPLGWVFASTHGLWTIGLAVGVLAVVGAVLDARSWQPLRGLAPLLLLQAAAAAATPLGPTLLLSPLTVGENGRRFVAEWQPGSLGDAEVAVVLGLVALLVAATLVRGTRWRPSELLTVLVSLVLAASAVRTAGPGVVILAPVLADHLLTHPREKPVARPGSLPVGGLLVAGLLGALVAVPMSSAVARTPRDVPVAMAPVLASLPRGTVVFSQTDVSGWLLWTAPQLTPVVDLRVESYSPQQMVDYGATYQARPGWQSLFDRSAATYALLPDDAPLAGALLDVRHWRVVDHLDGYVLMSGRPS